MTSESPALSIENFTKDYGAFRAVDGVSFKVYPGEIFGLLGPNGAGKTTIISTLVTLENLTSGLIKVFGLDLTKEPSRAKGAIGFVPQELIHYGFFSVVEILHYHITYYGMRLDKGYLKTLLERFQLDEHQDKLVSQLSGGMKRRLIIVKALLHRPKLLLLDEPTAGVDVELRASLWQLIREFREEGMAILLTTHYLEEAERLCDRIGVLDQGKLKRVDKTETLLQEHSSKKVTFVLSHPVGDVTHPLLKAQSDHHLDFQLPNAMPLLKVIREANIPFDHIRDVNIKVGTLEDVMKNILSNE